MKFTVGSTNRHTVCCQALLVKAQIIGTETKWHQRSPVKGMGLKRRAHTEDPATGPTTPHATACQRPARQRGCQACEAVGGNSAEHIQKTKIDLSVGKKPKWAD